MSKPQPHSPRIKHSPWTGLLSGQASPWSSDFPSLPQPILDSRLFSLRSQIWPQLRPPACDGNSEVRFCRNFMTAALWNVTCITFTSKLKRKTPWTMSREPVIGKTMDWLKFMNYYSWKWTQWPAELLYTRSPHEASELTKLSWKFMFKTAVLHLGPPSTQWKTEINIPHSRTITMQSVKTSKLILSVSYSSEEKELTDGRYS